MAFDDRPRPEQDYTAAYMAWGAASTEHWRLAQKLLKGVTLLPGELARAEHEFELAHRRLIAAVDRL
jgi:hypothetical protein